MRLHILIWTLILGFSAGVVAIAAKAPKEIVIKACQKARPPVAFPHAAHMKLSKNDCKSCHHTGANKACSAAGCHAGKAEGKRPGCAEMSLTRNPFHITCVSCHKKEKKGPTTCVACHKK